MSQEHDPHPRERDASRSGSAEVKPPTHDDMVAVRAMRVSPAVASAFADVLRLSSEGRSFRVVAVDDTQPSLVKLPEGAEIPRGTFRVVPIDEMLTTQRAADILNVSRPYLVKLLDGGTIPHVKVGRHRRIRAADLLEFKRERDRSRSAALDELVSSDQEAGLL